MMEVKYSQFNGDRHVDDDDEDINIHMMKSGVARKKGEFRNKQKKWL